MMEDVEFYSNFLREDSKNVEDIAKQISEHAEKIYQTWREKGLSANDLIQLHNPDFVKQVNTPLMLSPAQKEHRVVQSQVFGRRSLERPRPGLESTVDLIASPDIDATLEELVSSFVKEDKARLAARQTEPVSSRVSPLRSVTPQLDLVPQKRISPNRPCQEPIRISPVRVISPVTPQKSLTSVRDTNPITIPLRSTTPTKDVSPPHKSITHIGPEFSPPSPTPQRSTTPIRESKVSGIYITKTKENNLIPQRTEVSYKTDIVSNVEDYRNKAEMDSEIVKISQIIKTTHSTVDYAKKRYEVAQANPLTQQRLSNAKSIGKPLQMNVVSEARTRFESKETYRKKVIREEHSERRITREESETFQLPHPYVTAQQRQQLKSVMQSTTTSSNSVNGVPIRPFLTRGSVAERILIFEKRPEKSSHPLRKSVIKSVPWKCKDDLQVPQACLTRLLRLDTAVWPDAILSMLLDMCVKTAEGDSVISDIFNASIAQPLSPASTLTRKRKPRVVIPRFYFPHGRFSDPNAIEKSLEGIKCRLNQADIQHVSMENLREVTKLMNIPIFWKIPLFKACFGNVDGPMPVNDLLAYWKSVISTYHDEASQLVHILVAASGKANRNYLIPDDLVPIVQDVVETHPGLTFLKEAIEFHSRYVNTVIARIFYDVNRSWSGKLTIPEIRRSNLLNAIKILEEEEDINKITYYFSYEHFYVIYCKFWELDKDHDLFIDKEDLSRHSEHAISSRIIDRIFSGAVMRKRSGKKEIQKMSYSDFVWFLLAEEDKRHPTAIEYWFRCMDLDGDGYISMYELEYFYEEQLQKMESIGIESLPFHDCLCQMLDMVNPKEKGIIALEDLKKCKMTPIFFDTFVNLEKYLDHEQRDPFSSQADSTEDGVEVSDWDRYAAEEYALLVAEEGCADDNEESLQYLGKEEETPIA